ncbi:MAG: class I SAM-dependent methyltransferase [Pyrinomonadaceae bacterium]
MFRDFDLVQRLDFIRAICAGKKVLHLGCTDHPYTRQSIDNDLLLHFELEKIASDLWGMDGDEEGIEVLRSQGSKQLIVADLEKLDELTLEAKFDVIIAGEMIEHLNNPGLFLSGIKRFMDEKTELVITTTNAYCAFRFFYYGLRGRGGRQEPIHPDHVSYYSFSTLSHLLQRHGLTVDKFLFYDIGHEHRPHGSRILNAVNDISVRFSSQLADGLIAVCRSSE